MITSSLHWHLPRYHIVPSPSSSLETKKNACLPQSSKKKSCVEVQVVDFENLILVAQKVVPQGSLTFLLSVEECSDRSYVRTGTANACILALSLEHSSAR